MTAAAANPASPVQAALVPRVEDFRGDYAPLAAMMLETWSRRKEQALVYSEEYLRSVFAYPGMSPALAPAIYGDAGPVAFIAGPPRRLAANGRRLNVVRASLLTTSMGLGAKGWGIVVWSALARRARALGFDGVINCSVAGLGADAFFAGCARRLGMTAARLYSAACLARLLRPGIQGESAVAADPELFLSAANALAARTPFARLWTLAEAEWECRSRSGAVSVQSASGGRAGVLAGYVMQLTGAGAPKCLLIENVLWGGLDAAERRALLRSFLARAQEAGAGMALAPCTGSFDLAPLHECGFRLSRRVIDIYLCLWQPTPIDEPQSVYLDIF